MINNEAFIKRLKKVIEFYGETASSFAGKIDVQRSSISHILSGRNKPSLDFIMKVLSSFPEVELYWLLNGKGDFPSQKNEVLKSTSTSKNKLMANSEKAIERIVVFYNDGSFKSYEN
jgi:transcriptional regulator with XRE-family HTH domain